MNLLNFQKYCTLQVWTYLIFFFFFGNTTKYLQVCLPVMAEFCLSVIPLETFSFLETGPKRMMEKKNDFFSFLKKSPNHSSSLISLQCFRHLKCSGFTPKCSSSCMSSHWPLKFLTNLLQLFRSFPMTLWNHISILGSLIFFRLSQTFLQFSNPFNTYTL